MPTGDPPPPPPEAAHVSDVLGPDEYTVRDGWVQMLAQANYSTRAAPSIPLNGQEGDVLVMRNGEPVWVSPREAFRLDCSRAPDGTPVGRELFENLISIEARDVPEKFSIPSPPEPGPPPKKYRTAWAAILDDELDGTDPRE